MAHRLIYEIRRNPIKNIAAALPSGSAAVIHNINKRKENIMCKKKIRRGDVFLADLNPVVGSEEGGNRPVLIVQNNTGNRNSRTTIVAPITRKLTSSYLPVHVIVSPSVTGLQETSSVMLEQIRVMDKERLKEKVGHLPPFLMTLVDRAIRVSVGLKSEYN